MYSIPSRGTVKYPVDYLAEEYLLRKFIQDSQEAGIDISEADAGVPYRLAVNLRSQNRFADAEAMVLKFVADARTMMKPENLIRLEDKTVPFLHECIGLFFASMTQKDQGKFAAAESNMREAIHCSVRQDGDKDPWAFDQRLRLAGWLREWGRDEDADALIAENNKLLELYDSDEEVVTDEVFKVDSK